MHKTSQMRIDRPRIYTCEDESVLMSQIAKPKVKKVVAKVISEHPEMLPRLESMLKNAILHNSNIDFYRMSSERFQQIDEIVTSEVKSITNQGL